MIVLRVDPQNPDPDFIRKAADAIRRGELVIFPTETVYGLAADAFNEEAARRVFDAKGRAQMHPLPIQIAQKDQLYEVASEVPKSASLLAERFWPGPLTLVLPKAERVPDIVTGGEKTIGVRMPDHPVALALIKEVGRPIIATSANVSGCAPPETADAAIDMLGCSVSVVLDAGKSRIGIASTVVDVSVSPAEILRVGTISAEQIKEVLGEIDERSG
jgi:L-threonylcarbamoyladenylate synthase